MDNEAFEGIPCATHDVTLQDFAERSVFQADVLAVLSRADSRVCIVDCSLWIVSASSAAVIVLQSNGDFIRRLHIHEPHTVCCSGLQRAGNNLQPVAVTQTLKGEIVVAGCGLHHGLLYRFNKGSHLDDLGLVHTSSDGSIEHVLSEGHFVDVVHDAHCVYGLEQSDHSRSCYRVRSFYTNERGNWIHVTDTCLQNGVMYDRLQVRNSMLYLSRVSETAAVVDQFNQDGILVSSLTCANPLIHAPHLADLDVSGSFLLTDTTSNHLCVLGLDRSWRTIDVINIVEPVSAQLHCATGIIWIIGRDKRTKTAALFAISLPHPHEPVERNDHQS